MKFKEAINLIMGLILILASITEMLNLLTFTMVDEIISTPVLISVSSLASIVCIICTFFMGTMAARNMF